MSEAPQQGEQFKAKIEQGVDKALPAEQIKNLKGEVKAETEKSNALKSQIKDVIKKAFGAEKTADLAITAEEKLAVFNDVKAQLVKQLGGEEQANNIMQKFGLHTPDKLMSKIGLRSVEEQKLYEKFNDFLNNKPGYIFGFAKQIKDTPWGKDMMEKAAEKSPESAFFYYKEFADMKDEGAKSILQTCATKNPEAAFKYLKNYQDMDKPEEVLQFAVSSMEKPETALKYLSTFSGLSGAKDILISIVNTMQKPEDIFNLTKELGKVDGASEVLLNALLRSQDKAIAFDKIDQYKTIPDAASVLILALPMMGNKERAFQEVGKYSDIANADTVLTNALMMGASPENAFTWLGDYQNIPNAKGVLAIAATMDPKKALEEYASYKDLPNNGAIDIVKTAVTVNPDLAFDNMGMLKNISPEFLNTAMLNAVDAKPENAFLKYDTLKDLPKEIKDLALTTAAERNPSAAILNYEKYNDQTVLKTAAMHMRPMDLMNNEIWKKLEATLKPGVFKTEMFKELNAKYNECKAIGEDILKYQNVEADQWGDKYYLGITEKFFKDPSLQKILKVNPDWIKPLPEDTSLNDARTLITRNLHFQNINPSEQTVKAEWKVVLEHKERYKNLTLFQNRNVVMLSDNQMDGYKYRFGEPKLQKSIADQGTKSFKFARAEYGNQQLDSYQEKLEAIKKTKSNIINLIINTPPPLSFYYTGHSGPKTICLAEYSFKAKPEDKHNTSISDKEFAELLRQRNVKYRNEYKSMDTRPIIVLASCFTSEFMRNVYSNLSKSHPLPIGITSSEYGSMSQGKAAEKYDEDVIRAEFAKNLLGLDSASKNKPTTMGTVFKNEKSNKENNPVILIPTRKVGGRQLA